MLLLENLDQLLHLAGHDGASGLSKLVLTDTGWEVSYSVGGSAYTMYFSDSLGELRVRFKDASRLVRGYGWWTFANSILDELLSR